MLSKLLKTCFSGSEAGTFSDSRSCSTPTKTENVTAGSALATSLGKAPKHAQTLGLVSSGSVTSSVNSIDNEIVKGEDKCKRMPAAIAILSDTVLESRADGAQHYLEREVRSLPVEACFNQRGGSVTLNHSDLLVSAISAASGRFCTLTDRQLSSFDHTEANLKCQRSLRQLLDIQSCCKSSDVIFLEDVLEDVATASTNSGCSRVGQFLLDIQVSGSQMLCVFRICRNEQRGANPEPAISVFIAFLLDVHGHSVRRPKLSTVFGSNGGCCLNSTMQGAGGKGQGHVRVTWLHIEHAALTMCHASK